MRLPSHKSGWPRFTQWWTPELTYTKTALDRQTGFCFADTGGGIYDIQNRPGNRPLSPRSRPRAGSSCLGVRFTSAHQIRSSNLRRAAEEGLEQYREIFGHKRGHESGFMKFDAKRCTNMKPEPKYNQIFKKMSQDQLNAFAEALKADSSLLEKVNGAADSDAVLAIAKDLGFAFTAEELENLIEQNMEDSEDELTVEQLESVAGGAVFAGAAAGAGAFIIGAVAARIDTGIKQANR